MSDGIFVYRYMVWAIVVLVLVIAGVVAEPYFATQSAPAGGPGGLAGQPAPVFDVRDDLGRSVSLQSYRGRVVVMNLWASWCPPCRAEMPDLQRLAASSAYRDVSIVGVNEGESAQRARAFALSLGISFPIWVDSSQRYGRAYGALGLPTTVILDRRGVVVLGFDRPLTFEEMRAAVGAALKTR